MGQCILSFESLTKISFLGEGFSQAWQVLDEGDSGWLHTFLQAAATPFHSEKLHKQ